MDIRRDAAISSIQQLALECGDPGWDGNGAEPISQDAAAMAGGFVRALPEGLPLPEFAPEPDGATSIDLIQSRSRLFSLSVGTSACLAYAWLDGNDRGHAVAGFDGKTVPRRILEGIEGIVGNAKATVEAA